MQRYKSNGNISGQKHLIFFHSIQERLLQLLCTRHHWLPIPKLGDPPTFTKVQFCPDCPPTVSSQVLQERLNPASAPGVGSSLIPWLIPLTNGWFSLTQVLSPALHSAMILEVYSLKRIKHRCLDCGTLVLGWGPAAGRHTPETPP